MAEHEAGLSVPRNVPFNTIVTAVMMLVMGASSFAASWAIFNEKLASQAATINQLYTHVVDNETRLRQLERDGAVRQSQLDYLIRRMDTQPPR